jgi:glycosyltransferase involved in cell wall biosynthesis
VDRGPKGPGWARNRGAEQARGEILVFIDADVCVHEDSLRRFAELFRGAPDVTAAFGAYDDEPELDDFISQYRNLYHRYVHLQGAGETETFWAGCGGVRRKAFLAVGGYDAERYQRPQIEDIDLGYRLRDAGHRIVLDPAIQVKHLKRWTLGNTFRTDLFDRGIPWMRLLLERSGGSEREETLNLNSLEKVKTAMLGGACALLLVGVVLRDPRWAVAAVGLVALLVLMNLSVYRWFGGMRGWPFALGVIPMNLGYYFVSGVAAAVGYAERFTGRHPRRRLPEPLVSSLESPESSS